MMRILFVSPYFPIPQRSGGKVRVFHVLRELAKTERVTLACGASWESEPFIREVEEWGVEVHWIPREVRRRPLARHLQFLPTRIPFSLVDPDPPMRELVQRLWRTQSYDLLQVEFLAMAYLANDPMFDGRRFLTHHYSATDHYRRARKIQPKTSARYWIDLVDGMKIPAYEREMLELFSTVFVTSDQDRSLLSSVAPRARFAVANNGVDTSFFQSRRAAGGGRSNLVVSTCSFTTDTNIDSVVWFLKEVWPLVLRQQPDARYEIIGYDPPVSVREAASRASGVTVVGGVEDVRPSLDCAAASLITMRAGSGTKIRALTSLSMGLPIVATPLGAEGLKASEREGVFVASSPEGLASATVKLLRAGVDPSTRERARDYVERHHSWKAAVDAMRNSYQETLSG